MADSAEQESTKHPPLRSECFSLAGLVDSETVGDSKDVVGRITLSHVSLVSVQSYRGLFTLSI